MFTRIKKQESGFTIVELLIVIVVIGILAALVLNTFQGVQARARDTERTTDINALHTQYEVYYNDNGYYPTFAVAAAAANFPGLDTEALNDPNGNGLNNGAVPAVNSTDNGYYYQANNPVGCDNAAPATQCVDYTLGVVKESDGTQHLKNSLN